MKYLWAWLIQSIDYQPLFGLEKGTEIELTNKHETNPHGKERKNMEQDGINWRYSSLL